MVTSFRLFIEFYFCLITCFEWTCFSWFLAKLLGLSQFNVPTFCRIFPSILFMSLTIKFDLLLMNFNFTSSNIDMFWLSWFLFNPWVNLVITKMSKLNWTTCSRTENKITKEKNGSSNFQRKVEKLFVKKETNMNYVIDKSVQVIVNSWNAWALMVDSHQMVALR